MKKSSVELVQGEVVIHEEVKKSLDDNELIEGTEKEDEKESDE